MYNQISNKKYYHVIKKSNLLLFIWSPDFISIKLNISDCFNFCKSANTKFFFFIMFFLKNQYAYLLEILNNFHYVYFCLNFFLINNLAQTHFYKTNAFTFCIYKRYIFNMSLFLKFNRLKYLCSLINSLRIVVHFNYNLF
jgi:hypothetical protein